MSCKTWMIWVSPRTPDRLSELCGSHVQQSEALRAMISACGPYNSGGSSTLHILVDCILTSISKVQQVGKLDGIPHSVQMKGRIVYCCIGRLWKQSSSSKRQQCKWN
jgi:hypothetical protein